MTWLLIWERQEPLQNFEQRGHMMWLYIIKKSALWLASTEARRPCLGSYDIIQVRDGNGLDQNGSKEVIRLCMCFDSRTNTVKKGLRQLWAPPQRPRHVSSLSHLEVGLQEQDWEAQAGHPESKLCSASLEPSLSGSTFIFSAPPLLSAPGPPTTIWSQSPTPALPNKILPLLQGSALPL